MSKYYKVYLIDDSKNRIEDYTTIEQNYAICKETEAGFKELITEKCVYPRAAGTPTPALTFGRIPTTLCLYHNKNSKSLQENSGETKMIGMTAEDILIWWSSMNEKTLKEYVANINRLEKIAISKYYGVEQILTKKDKKDNSKKSIKRISRKIK